MKKKREQRKAQGTHAPDAEDRLIAGRSASETSSPGAMRIANETLLEDTEARLLLEGVRQCYGFDFRDYDPSWLRRQLWDRARAEGVETLSALQDRVLHDTAALERLLHALALPRALFADPDFYLTFRTHAVPLLRTYPSFTIWHPACSSGEEAYSLAILLDEEGLASRARVYATDLSASLFARARDGAVRAEAVAACEDAYRRAGGKKSLRDYWTLIGEEARIRRDIHGVLYFAEHQLVTDGVLNEFEVIVAAKATAHLVAPLQDRLHALFYRSLSRFGLLCLGPEEPLPSLARDGWYEPLEHAPGFYRKVVSPTATDSPTRAERGRPWTT